MHVDSPCIDFGQEILELSNVVQDVDLVMLCTTLFEIYKFSPTPIASCGFKFFSNRFVVNNTSKSCSSKQFKFYIMHMETIKLTSKWVQVQ